MEESGQVLPEKTLEATGYCGIALKGRC